MVVWIFIASLYVVAVTSVFGTILVVCMASRSVILVLICWRASRMLVSLRVGIDLDMGLDMSLGMGLGMGRLILIHSYIVWKVVVMFLNVARSIVILLTFVLQEALYISCSLLRA